MPALTKESQYRTQILGNLSLAPNNTPLSDIAEQLTCARQKATVLKRYPGPLPTRMSTAYEIQEHAIRAWPDSIAGWKVGRIAPELETSLNADRLAGPIFSQAVHPKIDGSEIEVPVYRGGFAAVEAEFIAVIAEDTPAHKTSWSFDECLAVIERLHIGLEIASSPLASINQLGPCVVVSDFGNNAGLVVGPPISNWRERTLDSLTNETRINSVSVGTGSAANLPGGYVRSVQFILETCAARGRPLKKGQVIATGQTNGIHAIQIGQSAELDFGRDGCIRCAICEWQPLVS